MESLQEKIKDYIHRRATDKLEAFDRNAENQKKASDSGGLEEITQKLSEQRAALEQQYQLRRWLDDAAKRARQISLVSHAPKFTNSDTHSSGVIFQQKPEISTPLISSAVLTDYQLDVVGNAAALDVASLLQLKSNGVSLLDELASGDSPTLKTLATSDEQYEFWFAGFQQALTVNTVSSGQLSKQIYYPVAEDYHLLSPLYASCLSHEIYQRVTFTAYSEEAKDARRARKNAKYHPLTVVSYPDLAVQNYGGTKPQNISKLNSVRSGRGYLLSCRPPSWQHQSKPPTNGKKTFWHGYSKRCWKAVRFLKDYLEKIYELPNIKGRRDFRAELVDELVDTLLIYAAEIQSMQQWSGWSRDCDLSRAEQLWLDPWRCQDDEDFKVEREVSDWKAEIAGQFAAWLNHAIGYKSDKLYPDDQTHHEWKRLLERKLALLKDDLEMTQ